MDESSVKKALLLQLMKVLSEDQFKEYKGKEPMVTAIEIESEEPEMEDEDDDMSDCEPGSKEYRAKMLKKLAAKE